MNTTPFIIDNYSIDDLLDLFSLDKTFTIDDLNKSLITLLKKYSALGEQKYIIFLKKAREKLIAYHELNNGSGTQNGDENSVSDTKSDDYIDEEEKKELLDNDVNDTTLYQKEYLNDVFHNRNYLVNRKDVVAINDEDKHFVSTRNRLPISQSHSIPIVKGQINPLLRNINKRIINIDTQMRNYLSEDSNNLTLDLSEPLNNVIAMRVLSVEIRHCWYTFDEVYGTTSFKVDNSNIIISNGNYSANELITQLNDALTNASISYLDVSYNTNTGKVSILNNDTMSHTVTFYDNNVPGNMKKNNSLGWLLGYRTFDTSYNIQYNIGAGETIIGDALLDVYGPRYLLLEVEDFNNNHFNRNFVGIDDSIVKANYPSYYTPDISLSDPSLKFTIDSNGNTVWVDSGLTQAQQLTISSVYQSRLNENSNENKVSGLKTNDILSKLPVQYSSNYNTLVIGYNFINKNERLYYGPVNISRIKVALYNDKGQLLHLNKQDFSITLQTDEFYQF